MNAPPDMFSIKDLIIAIPAFVGMFLGFYNLWHENQKSKIKLEVLPASVKNKGLMENGDEFAHSDINHFDYSISQGLYAYTIINHSLFDVVISEAGIINLKEDLRHIFPRDMIKFGDDLPMLLKPKTSLSIYLDIDRMISVPSFSKFVPYVKADSGYIETGMSKSYKELVKYWERVTA